MKGLFSNFQVLLQVGYFITSRPELQPGFVLKDEVKNFCLAIFVKPKLLLIAICSRWLQRPALPQRRDSNTLLYAAKLLIRSTTV
ncbi:MAG: hypothetical protein ABJA79_10270 [Parafilimonas sp.]